MRRRLLVSALALIAVTLLAFALPLGLVVRNLLVTRALDTLEGTVAQVAVFGDEQARTCQEIQLLVAVAARDVPITLTLLTREGELVATTATTRPDIGGEIDEALRGQVGRRHADERLAVATTLSSEACAGQRLVLHGAQPDDALSGSVRGAWLIIGIVGLAVLGLAGLAAVLLGRQLSRPFEALAGSARRLGDGDFTARAPRAGLGEADAIADALDATGDRLERATERAAAFTADASHQLRTPMTALRLHLESLAAAGNDPTALDAALREVDRLDATVDELVALTRLDAAEREVDLAELVAARLPAWRALAAESGRQVTLEQVPTPPARVRPAAVAQALEVLVDNALDHGRGTITVRLAPSLPGAARTGIRICVRDEGSGLPAGALPTPGGRDRGVAGPHERDSHARGRGLALAGSLIAGERGQLRADPDAATTTVCILLPEPTDHNSHGS